MTFLQLQQKLARRRGANDASFVTGTQMRYKDALNEAHRACLRMPGMDSLRYATMTVASVANQQGYAVPHEGIARVNWMWDPTNRMRLKYRTRQDVREMNPSAIAGTPWVWSPTGYVEAHTQPSDASELFVKSTAAGTQTAYIEGYITGGYYRTASVALTGTTAVTLSITNWIQVTKFYLSAATTGTVTLLEDSGSGTELARITIGRTRARYYGFLLEPVPAAVVTYNLDVLRDIPDMSVDTDEPLLPDDFHDLLIDKAELKELRKQDDPNRHNMLSRDIKQAENDLKTFVINHPDWRPNWGGSPIAFSQLGGQFPADIVVGY